MPSYFASRGAVEEDYGSSGRGGVGTGGDEEIPWHGQIRFILREIVDDLKERILEIQNNVIWIILAYWYS